MWTGLIWLRIGTGEEFSGPIVTFFICGEAKKRATDEVEEDEIGGACRTNGGEEERV
jgi:hypothetical protein